MAATERGPTALREVEGGKWKKAEDFKLRKQRVRLAGEMKVFIP